MGRAKGRQVAPRLGKATAWVEWVCDDAAQLAVLYSSKCVFVSLLGFRSPLDLVAVQVHDNEHFHVKLMLMLPPQAKFD